MIHILLYKKHPLVNETCFSFKNIFIGRLWVNLDNDRRVCLRLWKLFMPSMFAIMIKTVMMIMSMTIMMMVATMAMAMKM